MDREKLLRRLAVLGEQHTAASNIGWARQHGLLTESAQDAIIALDNTSSDQLSGYREALADDIMAAIENAKRLVPAPAPETEKPSNVDQIRMDQMRVERLEREIQKATGAFGLTERLALASILVRLVKGEL